MNESEYSTMTKDEMQRLVDEEIASGKSYEEALKKLARIIGIRPSEESLSMRKGAALSAPFLFVSQ